MSDIEPGVWRHWKGGLYEVIIPDAHDANGTEQDGRTVVVYRSMADGEYWVRTTEDFRATVHTEDGTTCAGEQCSRIVGKKFADRFTYLGLGPVLTSEMLSE